MAIAFYTFNSWLLILSAMLYATTAIFSGVALGANSKIEHYVLSDDDKERLKEVRLLGKEGGPEAGESLLTIYEHDSQPMVRREALKGLVKLRHSKATKSVIQASKAEKDYFARYDAICSLPYIAGDEAIPVLLEILDGKEDTEYPLSRLFAAEGLGTLGNLRGYEYATEKLRTSNGKDPRDAQVQDAAIRALVAMGDLRAIETLESVRQNGGYQAWHANIAIVQIKAKSIKDIRKKVSFLCDVLNDKDSSAEMSRKHAAYALINLEDKKALQCVVDIARATDHPGQMQAIEAMEASFAASEIRRMLEKGKAIMPGGHEGID